MRKRINALLGLDSYDIYGLTELYGPGAGIDCTLHAGIHYWDDYFLVELIDPDSGDLAAPGAVGEIVLTTLRKEAMPLLRYRTHDLTRLLPGPCGCGSPYSRFDRLLGRSDDMVKVRGVALYPSQVDTVLSGLPDVASEYQLVVERHAGRDEPTLRVECALDPQSLRAPALADEIARAFRASIGVTPRVELLAIGTLPRTDRKTRRVYDRREE
jgi:phenylacetate-CoA ligase